MVDGDVDMAEPGRLAKRIDRHQRVGGAQNSPRRICTALVHDPVRRVAQRRYENSR